MKRNRIFMLFAAVLVLTLVSTSLVAGTFAKYTKAVTGTDTARVAKFAFDLKDGATGLADETTVGSIDIDLFSTTDSGLYDNGNDGEFIAPGTSGSFTVTLENSSEVDVAVQFAVAETNTGSIPIYYTIGADTQRYSSVLTGAYGEGAGAGTYDDLDALATAVSGTCEAVDATADPVVPTTVSATLNWAWGFDSEGTGQSDSADTALGAAGTAEVTVTVTCTVTQVD